jgi:hypothetical protein
MSTLFSWLRLHLAWLYWACAAVLTPWVFYLYQTQAPSGPAHHLHLLDVGLFLAMAGGLVVTARTYRRRSALTVMAAAFTATAVANSVRFRLLTHAGGPHWLGSAAALLTVDIAVLALCVTVISNRLSGRPYLRWMPAVLVVVALVLVPFFTIDETIGPKVQIAHHLKLAWAGLDMFEVLALAATALALQHRPRFAVVPATVTGTLLVCDAWLNIVPSTGLAFWGAIAMAFIELPLAALSFWVAVRTLRDGTVSARPGVSQPVGDQPPDAVVR